MSEQVDVIYVDRAEWDRLRAANAELVAALRPVDLQLAPSEDDGPMHMETVILNRDEVAAVLTAIAKATGE